MSFVRALSCECSRFLLSSLLERFCFGLGVFYNDDSFQHSGGGFLNGLEILSTIESAPCCGGFGKSGLT